jgi:hypothetical protein
MFKRIKPQKIADLPERKLALWRLAGPGAVMVGLSIGAGELVIWPIITAQHGAGLAWAAVLGVFLQMWVNIEVGRWTVATGESPYTGFGRMFHGFLVAFIILNVLGWILPGWGRASGLALKALIFDPNHDSSDMLWTAITFAGVALVLFGPRRIYIAVERTVGVLVILITIGLIYIAFRVGTGEYVRDLGRGLVNFMNIDQFVGKKEEGLMTVKAFFIAVVFAGAGGTANLFYSYYLRDKQIGMGGRIPVIINPARDREEASSESGYTFPDDESNRDRFRDWMKFIYFDQTVFFWLLNTLTMMLFIFGALCVLRPKGIVPQAGTLLWDEAVILADTMGPAGRVLFLVIGLATLFSTQVTLVDGLARSLADLFKTTFRAFQDMLESKIYFVFAVFVIVMGVVLTGILDKVGATDLSFLFNAAWIGGIAMGLYTPLLLWMNLRHLPASARPGPINIVMMCVCTLVYSGFAIFCLITEFKSLMEKFNSLPIV